MGSGCIAQVYRGWARVDQVEDPAFQSIVEEMEKEDLLEAWEIPGLGGMARSLRQLWRGSGEEESSEDKSLLDGQQEERLIPVAIKVSLARLCFPSCRFTSQSWSVNKAEHAVCFLFLFVCFILARYVGCV